MNRLIAVLSETVSEVQKHQTFVTTAVFHAPLRQTALKTWSMWNGVPGLVAALLCPEVTFLSCVSEPSVAKIRKKRRY